MSEGCGKEKLPSKGHTQNLSHSRTQGGSSNFRSDPPAHLEEPWEEAEGNWSSLRRYRHWWQSFWGAHSFMWTMVLVSASLESFLKSVSNGTSPWPPACLHQYWDASGQVIPQGWGCLKIPWAHSLPRIPPCTPEDPGYGPSYQCTGTRPGTLGPYGQHTSLQRCPSSVR